MPNTLNDIFAHLDNAKASRAYETNQERRRKVEEAEHERKRAPDPGADAPGLPRAEVLPRKGRDRNAQRVDRHPEHKVDLAVDAPRRDGAGAEAVHAALDQHITDIVHGALGRRRDADHADGGQHLGVQAQLFRPDMPRRTLGPGDAAQRQHRAGDLT